MAKHSPLRTYADAYVSSLPKKADGVAELLLYQKILSAHPSVRSFLSDPGIPKKDRITAIKIINKEATEETVSFICMLGEDGLLNKLDRIVDQTRKSYKRLTPYEYIRITSAVELTKEEQKRIERAINKQTKSEIRLEQTVDPGILGGLIIQKDDWVLNASLQGRLEHLKRLLHV